MAFLRDTSSPQPFLRLPAAVMWLAVALLGTHALRVWVFPQYSNWLIGTYGFVPAWYSHAYLAARGAIPGSVVQRALPFVTYMFLHGSWAHVGINTIWFLAFAPVVARRFGTLLFLVFFLICGAAGAGVHLALNWGEPNPLIGASAGIAGLMAAAFRMLPSGRDQTWQRLEPIFSRRIIIWTILWLVINLVAGLTGMGTGQDAQVVAWQAHIGGYFAGLLLAGPFDMLIRPRILLRPQA